MSTELLSRRDRALIDSLASDYDETTPDAHVIARQLVYEGKRHNVPATVRTADMARAITQISSDHTTGKQGAPTLALTLQDARWNLLDSGFFAMDDTGALLDFDLNYPQPSRFWWRLHQVSPQAGYTIQLTFVPRIVAELMGHFGPLMANRAKRTRAEFLKMLCAKINDPQGPIEFYSRELDAKQPVDATTVKSTKSSSTSAAGKATKAPGIGANNPGLTAKGTQLNSTQLGFANLIIHTCQQESAGTTVTQACIFAAICESDLGMSMGWDAGNPTYGGLLAGSVSNFGSIGSASSDAVATEQIKSFVNGGRGYNSAKSLQGTFHDIGQLAAHVEGCVISGGFGPNGYGQYQAENPPAVIKEAQAIVQAGGGGGSIGASPSTSTTVTTAQPYYFTVNAGESYWAAMCRLSQEVNWELVIDGNRVYYDADTELIKQKVATVIHRDAPTTFGWSYDWINRQPVTNFQVEIAMRLFEFCAGEVVQVASFGPASQGSMAKPPLPGRWLIAEIQHNGGDLYSTLTLVQPSPPKKEPAPTTTTTTSTTGGSTKLKGVQSPGTPEAAYAAAQQLAAMKLPYVWGGGHGAGQLGAHPTGLDCSGSVSWVLKTAGFQIPGGGSSACVSGDYTPGQAGLLSGPGQYMTIWANADHVFIRIHPQGMADMQGNTVSPLVHNRGFDFFPWTTPGCGGWGGPSPGVGAPTFYPVHYPAT